MQRIYKAAKQCGYLQGLIEPLEIEYDGSHPFDNIEITIKRRNK